MARVNIEDRCFGEQRLHKFAKAMDWTLREALGCIAYLWHESQEQLHTRCTIADIFDWCWCKDEAESHKIATSLLEAGYMHSVGENLFEIHGNQIQIDARVKHLARAHKGGKSTRIKWKKIRELQQSESNEEKAGLAAMPQASPNLAQYNARQGNTKQCNSMQGNLSSLEKNPEVKRAGATKNFKYTDWDMDISRLFKTVIIDVNPKAVKAHNANLEQWADQFRLMRERDKLTKEDIENTLNWVFKDDFWRATIYVPSGFRKNWDSITRKMGTSKEKNYGNIANDAAQAAYEQLTKKD